MFVLLDWVHLFGEFKTANTCGQLDLVCVHVLQQEVQTCVVGNMLRRHGDPFRIKDTFRIYVEPRQETGFFTTEWSIFASNLRMEASMLVERFERQARTKTHTGHGF